MADHPTASAVPPQAPKRPLSLGVIFLTLVIDLVGFSIIFPLGPHLVQNYLDTDGQSGLLGFLLSRSEALAHALGRDHAFAAVLFGGILTSVFSVLQFIFAPFWGALSDRRGRRGVLRMTVLGNAVGYALWVVSGSFWVFLVSRIVSGAFSGNLSVATAAVADVTTREERSRAMGIVGAAFGIGLVMGPVIGAVSAPVNLLAHHPSLARFGINPFSVPALISLALCGVNYLWITRSFKETLPPESRAGAAITRVRNPLSAILALHNPSVRRANAVAFVHALAFVAMESSLTYLAAERFHYTDAWNGILLVFLGICSILTQGIIVRRILKGSDEVKVLKQGLAMTCAGLLMVGLCTRTWGLYTGVAFLAYGAGLVNPSTTGLISLYSTQDEQGRVLGIFRSLGSLARAITPITAGIVFFILGSRSVFLGGAVLSLTALGLASALPKPSK